jgi:hypothetical protein
VAVVVVDTSENNKISFSVNVGDTIWVLELNTCRDSEWTSLLVTAVSNFSDQRDGWLAINNIFLSDAFVVIVVGLVVVVVVVGLVLAVAVSTPV